jgi:NAD(P)-dependent dehydrogenase (short-subunit alcohol dehydrogenase family)
MKQVIVVTGASSGFGALAARALGDAGHTVYASMRETTSPNTAQVKAVEEYATAHNADLRTVELDVASQESAHSAIRKIVEEHGRLDVIVHNAGHMVFGPAEAFTPEQFAELYDVNVLSTQRVNRAALPQLRKQGRGLLVWVSSSSVAGGTPPYLSPYFAAKAGMDALAVLYAREVALWVSRLRLSCQARLRKAPTTSRMPACRRTRTASPNTKPGHIKVMARKSRKHSPQSCPRTRTLARSRKPS